MSVESDEPSPARTPGSYDVQPEAPHLSTIDVWHEVVDDAAIWARFNQRFAFKANYYERSRPAIRLDPGCLVIDLAPICSGSPARCAADEDRLEQAAFQAFADLAGDGEIFAIDWQHPTYRYSPRVQVDANTGYATSVFPDGDYYAHMPADLAWGTFGHPWQQTLTLWGGELIATLGADLLTWLPKHDQSRV
ncbi:DUF2716 domain-containing protein [Nocardioides sp. NPDC057772]|uniref:DUF2716 domain-containing protein n=1 Tax=Nocardioides sp. NPDC057772 TaxID=3346245 RepID=UPI00366F6C6D